MVAAVRRDGRGPLRVAAEPVPEGTFQLGPVGLQAVDRELLSGVVATIQERFGGPRRVAVVIPTAWSRIHLLEFDQLPRRTAEIQDVVRWRLKKLLPVSPAELRLAPRLEADREQQAVVVLSMLERAAAGLEAVFGTAALDIGYLGPRVLALASATPSPAPARLVVQEEPGFVSLVLIADGRTRMVRTKPVTAGGQAWAAIERELRLVLMYLRSDLGVTDELNVEVVADSSAHARAIEAWWSDQQGVRIEPQPASRETNPPGLAERIGASRLAPGWRLVDGRAA
jgi:hypothetical protein